VRSDCSRFFWRSGRSGCHGRMAVLCAFAARRSDALDFPKAISAPWCPGRSGPSGGPWTQRTLWRPLDAQDPLATPGRSRPSGGPWSLRTLWRALDAQDPLAAPGRSGSSGGPWTLRTLWRPLDAQDPLAAP
jgi:hypothetical protein